MRRLPLYCEVGPTILLTTAGEEITSPQERACRLYSCSVCVCYSVCLLQLVCVYLCVERAASCTLFGALLLCVVSGVFGCERE